MSTQGQQVAVPWHFSLVIVRSKLLVSSMHSRTASAAGKMPGQQHVELRRRNSFEESREWGSAAQP